MDLTTITITQFKSFFPRDFPYAPVQVANTSTVNPLDYVLDSDITKAFSEAQSIFNQGLLLDNNSITIAYLYLSAHFLSLDLRQAQEGINGVGSNIVSSRSVGNVSESYSIPERYLKPTLIGYTKTTYGLRFLDMVAPKLIGNVVAVFGDTNA